MTRTADTRPLHASCMNWSPNIEQRWRNQMLGPQPHDIPMDVIVTDK
jgi:hypothetical protein